MHNTLLCNILTSLFVNGLLQVIVNVVLHYHSLSVGMCTRF